MMKIFAIVVGLLLLVSSFSFAGNCQQIGSTTYCDDGTSYQRVGNTTDGTSYQRIGNTTYGR